MSELLLKIVSNKILAEDLRPSVLEIYDDHLAFHSNAGLIGGEEATINYSQVAEVNQYKGLLQSKLEIINNGGADDIVIEHLTNHEADQAKDIIEQKALQSRGQQTPPAPPNPEVASQ